jgi:transposase
MLRKKFVPKVRAERKLPLRNAKGGTRSYHKVTEQELGRMVEMRFKQNLSYKRISEVLLKPPMTVYYAIRHWNTYQAYVDWRKNNGSHVESKIALHKLQEFILDKKTLIEWSGYGLQDRCLLLEKKYDVQINWQALRRFYQKNNVRYLVSNYAYQQALKVDRNLILDFALELAQLID